MKAFIILILISLFAFSCANQSKSIYKKESKTNIVLNEMPNEHPNKKMMEGFLNNYEEEFIELNEDLGQLENKELIQNTYSFQTKSSKVSVFLIFCKDDKDAHIVGETNFSSAENNQCFGTNGAVLFVVNGANKSKVNSVLSYFAGEE